MKQPHLCLIEDDLIMGESLSDRFSLEGFTLDWYRRGSEAIDAMRDTQYAAVISDVRLPDVSGEQVFAVANESIAKYPTVFIHHGLRFRGKRGCHAKAGSGRLHHEAVRHYGTRQQGPEPCGRSLATS